MTAADPACPRCHGSGIDPDSKPMYHDGAPGIPDPAGYEPCDCMLRGGTDRDTTPVRRIQAYLEWEDDSEDAFIAAIHDDDGNRRSLQVADVRAVLAEHQAMRETLDGMGTGYGLEWTNRNTGEHGITAMTSEAKARELAAACHDHECSIVRRLVGGWKPVDDA